MDELIQAVVKALNKGMTIGQVHIAIIARGWSEDDAFLALKAGENLYNAIQIQEKELASRPPPFGRK